MFGEIGIDKLLLILGVVLVFFGPRRLPELGATLGKGIRDFKSAVSDLHEGTQVHVLPDDEPKQPA